MQINNNHNYINFGEKFKTKDILSFISGYPISRKSGTIETDKKIIKSMTGIDVNSDSFKKTGLSNSLGEIVLQTKGIEEMGKQNPLLKKADESADDIFIKVPKDKKEIKNGLILILKQ